uniref:F-box only protein 32-like n=1 Tax=Saccoglossus kowalevskii TaxID=10224 RepID=A0ABM0MJK9_SACKO|nr:PREDICTED: F-box only protein 32-like [Saccoglossus kowalevskii]
MPFLGRDFRAPGQNWVRAHKGWEILIALREKLNTHIRSLSKDRYAYLNEMPVSEQLPDKNSNMNNNNNNMEMHGDRNGCNRSLYIVIPKGRKDAGFMAGTVNIAEIMTRLDFGGVARDPRRFNYICKVLSLIVTEKFNEVSGTSQKHVMNVIGQIVNIVCESTQNIRECQCLLKLIEKAMKDGRHTHVGSTKVWQKKLDTVHVWQEMLNNIELYETGGICSSCAKQSTEVPLAGWGSIVQYQSEIS